MTIRRCALLAALLILPHGARAQQPTPGQLLEAARGRIAMGNPDSAAVAVRRLEALGEQATSTDRATARILLGAFELLNNREIYARTAFHEALALDPAVRADSLARLHPRLLREFEDVRSGPLFMTVEVATDTSLRVRTSRPAPVTLSILRPGSPAAVVRDSLVIGGVGVFALPIAPGVAGSQSLVVRAVARDAARPDVVIQRPIAALGQPDSARVADVAVRVVGRMLTSAAEPREPAAPLYLSGLVSTSFARRSIASAAAHRGQWIGVGVEGEWGSWRVLARGSTGTLGPGADSLARRVRMTELSVRVQALPWLALGLQGEALHASGDSLASLWRLGGPVAAVTATAGPPGLRVSGEVAYFPARSAVNDDVPAGAMNLDVGVAYASRRWPATLRLDARRRSMTFGAGRPPESLTTVSLSLLLRLLPR